MRTGAPFDFAMTLPWKVPRAESPSSFSGKHDQLECEIDQAEHLLSEKVHSIILARRNGIATAEAKAGAREMRRALEALYTQRRTKSF